MWRQGLWLIGVLCFVAGCSDALPVYKGLYDRSQYHYETLDNGLLVMLISDETQAKTAMALSVHAGGWQDPDSHPGLAHALEHWLFLGHERDPTPNALQHWLSQHGGERNALTTGEDTTYLLQVQPEVSEEALSQLQAMMQSPCLSLAPMRKEIDAIDAEFQGATQQRSAHIYRVRQQLWDSTQAASKFIAGNRQTLLSHGEEALQQAAKDFFNTYYHPQNSTLVVISPSPLKELKHWVQQTLGQWHTNEDDKTPKRSDTMAQPPFINQNTWTEIQWEQGREQWQILWALPDINPEKKQVARRWQEHFSSQSEGSLNHWLKTKGWGYASAHFFSGLPQHWMLMWSIALTEKGQDHVDEIYQYFWAAMADWQSQAQNEHSWEQRRQRIEYGFQHQSIGNPLIFAHQLSKILASRDPALILSEGLRGLDVPMTTENINTILTWRPEESEVVHVKAMVNTSTIEPMYQTPYLTLPLDQRAPAQTVDCPWLSESEVQRIEDNETPLRLTATKIKSEMAEPMVLSLGQDSSAWYRHLSESKFPQSIYRMAWRGGPLVASVEEWWLTQGLIFAWQDQLNTDQSKLKDWQASGQVRFYLDSMEWTFQAPLNHLGHLSSWVRHDYFSQAESLLTEARLDAFKQMVLETIRKQWPLSSPLDQAYRVISRQQYHRDWPDEQDVAVIEQLTLAQLKAHWRRWSQQSYKMALLEGAMSAQDAKAWLTPWQTWLDNQHASVSAQSQYWEKDDAPMLTRQVHAPYDSSVFLEVWHAPRGDEHAWGMTQLLGEYLAPKWFSLMRTEKQLAYSLHVQARVTEDAYPYLIWMLESPIVEPEEIDAAKQDFLMDMTQQLRQMTAEDWAPYKAALIKQLQQSLRQEKAPWRRDWEEIFMQRFDFYKERSLIQAIEKTTPEDLCQFFQQLQSHPLQGLKVMKALGQETDKKIPEKT